MRNRTIAAAIMLALVALAAPIGYGLYLDAFPHTETARLLDLLSVSSGATIAEIGAGEGRMALIAARTVASAGRLYVTELGQDRTTALKEDMQSRNATNVTVIEGGEASANLPASCCDAIYLSKVYHHFTQPADLNASIYESLRSGGRLAVIDFEPRWWRFWLSLPAGVPLNRLGHGMPISVLIDELESAGFVVERTISDWWAFPESRYCVVLRKP